jgi:hypothetical protein
VAAGFFAGANPAFAKAADEGRTQGSPLQKRLESSAKLLNAYAIVS